MRRGGVGPEGRQSASRLARRPENAANLPSRASSGRRSGLSSQSEPGNMIETPKTIFGSATPWRLTQTQ